MIFGENMAALTALPKSIFWKAPTILGAPIWDLAKYHMYYFHNRVMRPKFSCRLLYSETESLLHSVESPEFYKELSEEPQSVLSHFDFSNYPSDHFLFNASNKKVILKFKDEFAGDYTTKFICLKAKGILNVFNK